MVRRWLLFFLNSYHDAYWLKKASLTSLKLQRDYDERERERE